MKKLSDEQRVEICAMRESGQSYAQIARHFRVSSGAITWVCMEHGVLHPATTARPAPPTTREPIICADARTILRYTAAEDAMIQHMRTAGARVSDIGRALTPPRRHSSVTARLMTLARHQEMADG